MSMTKKVVLIVLVVGLGFVGLQSALARGWGGGMGGGMGGGGDCSCLGYDPGYQQLDDASKAKVDTFRSETLELRKQIAMKQAEKVALLQAATPDPAAVARVTGEMFDLKMEMQTKAQAAGIPMMMGGQGRMEEFSGKRGPGRGMGPCYNQQGWN